MAARKKAPPEAPPESVNGHLPGTLTPEGYVPKGASQRVRVPVYPDNPNVYVVYNLAIAYEMWRIDYEAPGPTPVERTCRKACAMISGWEGWNFIHPITLQPIPKPEATDWESYREIFGVLGVLTEMAGWLLNKGPKLALASAMGNSSPASTEDSENIGSGKSQDESPNGNEGLTN